MRAFSQEIITIERVTQSVRRFASFNASSELPSDLEDAILFWINKICVTVQLNIDKKLTGTGTSETIPKVGNTSYELLQRRCTSPLNPSPANIFCPENAVYCMYLYLKPLKTQLVQVLFFL